MICGSKHRLSLRSGICSLPLSPYHCLYSERLTSKYSHVVLHPRVNRWRMRKHVIHHTNIDNGESHKPVFNANGLWLQYTRTTRMPAFWGYPRRLMITQTIESYWIPSQKDKGQGQRSSHATHLHMVVIICTKYGNNRSRTENVTEWIQFSKSRSHDLEDIGQCQGSSHATHLLTLLIICTKYGKNPSWTVDATGRTRKVNGHTGTQTDGQTGWIQYTPPPP